MDTPLTAPRPRRLRADACYNRNCLLKAANAAFVEHGPDASLDEIAKRAGVGIGTLYRHFPTRQELIEAVFINQMDALVARAEALLEHPSPAEALTLWLRALLESSREKRCLGASIMVAATDERSAVSVASRAKSQAAAALIERAQKAGVVRPDVTSADVGRLVYGIALATEKLPDGAAQAERLLDLVLDSLLTKPPDATAQPMC